ncbi:uncharacterized protein [Watersipora subatra]|uniref:uncharacterized protein n=1 Tax=Watersipora subatra TaxID=2589382 RepID=UPI00355AEB44
MNSMALITSCLLLAGCVSFVRTESCYVCYSHLNEGCLDSKYALGESDQVTCDYSNSSITSGGCSKLKAVGRIAGFKFESVNRTCGVLADNSICAHRDWYDFEDPAQQITNTKVWHCSCEGDNCNASYKATSCLALTVLLSAGTLMRKYLL